MKKFMTVTSYLLPLKAENVDTDQIVPARFLKATTREGFGDKLFHDWRFDQAGKIQNSIFNDAFYQQARIMVVGKDFGIGSSREHAAWAISDFGIKTVIGSSFGDIFYNNSLKNGLLLVSLKKAEVKKHYDLCEKNKDSQVTVDLVRQWVILPDRSVCKFTIDPFRKNCLLEGVDDIGYILGKNKHIDKYESRII